MYYTLELTKRRNQYGEYVIKCYREGKYYEEGTYYTDDWNDALNTLNFEAARHKTIVVNSRLIKDGIEHPWKWWIDYNEE